MDGSCRAQIFPSRKLNALANTIYANIHTNINIIHTHTHTHTHHDPPTSVEMPVEKGKFWTGLWSQRGRGDSARWQAANSRQLEHWNWNNGNQWIWNCVLGFSKVSLSVIGGCVKFDTCKERRRKVRGKWTVEVTVGKSCDLVFAAEFHRQPRQAQSHTSWPQYKQCGWDPRSMQSVQYTPHIIIIFVVSWFWKL